MYLKTKKMTDISQTQPDSVLAKYRAIFVALRCTSGAGADRDRQGGTGNQGQGRGDKSERDICSKPAPRCKRENGVPLAGGQSTKPAPAAAITANRLQGRGVPIAPQKMGTVRRKPAIPPTRRPPSRQAPPQTGACETNNCAKTGKCNKKGEFCRKVALCMRRGS